MRFVKNVGVTLAAKRLTLRTWYDAHSVAAMLQIGLNVISLVSVVSVIEKSERTLFAVDHVQCVVNAVHAACVKCVKKCATPCVKTVQTVLIAATVSRAKRVTISDTLVRTRSVPIVLTVVFAIRVKCVPMESFPMNVIVMNAIVQSAVGV